jgi:hypothetical protein
MKRISFPLNGRGDGSRVPVKISGAQRSGRGPGPRLCCICFYLSRWYQCVLTVKIIPFRTSTSHSAAESRSFRVSVKIFSRGGGRKSFQRGQYIHSSAQPLNRKLWISNFGLREVCGGQLFAWGVVCPLPAVHRRSSKTALNKMKNKCLSLLEIRLFLDPEDGGSHLSRNVQNGLHIYTASLVSFPMRCVCVFVCVCVWVCESLSSTDIRIMSQEHSPVPYILISWRSNKASLTRELMQWEPETNEKICNFIKIIFV